MPHLRVMFWTIPILVFCLCKVRKNVKDISPGRDAQHLRLAFEWICVCIFRSNQNVMSLLPSQIWSKRSTATNSWERSTHVWYRATECEIDSPLQFCRWMMTRFSEICRNPSHCDEVCSFTHWGIAVLWVQISCEQCHVHLVCQIWIYILLLSTAASGRSTRDYDM